MKFAIVAGGEGSRLRSEGVLVQKPLVRLGDETLLARLIRIFAQNEAEEIVLLARTEADEVVAEARCAAVEWGTKLTVVRADTPSSMHSFSALVAYLHAAPFCLTTVDTVFSEVAFNDYIASFRRLLADGDADGLMGVTTLIDDEKPLYVEVDSDGFITAFLDESNGRVHHVSAGVYGLTPPAIDTLQRCMTRGESRLRNFQRALLTDGLLLRAHDFGAVIDIDHAADIDKAEKLIHTDFYSM